MFVDSFVGKVNGEVYALGSFDGCIKCEILLNLSSITLFWHGMSLVHHAGTDFL